MSTLPSDSSALTASALANASEDELPNELWDIELDLDLSFPRAWSGANIRTRAETNNYCSWRLWRVLQVRGRGEHSALGYGAVPHGEPVVNFGIQHAPYVTLIKVWDIKLDLIPNIDVVISITTPGRSPTHPKTNA